MVQRKDANNYSVQSVVRAFKILESLCQEKPQLSLVEISKKVGLSKPTVFRLLSTLKSLGYTEQDLATGDYRIGLKAFEVGSTFLTQMSVHRIAMPFIQDLVEKCNETVHLAILNKREIVYIDKVEGSQTIRMMSAVGRRAPAHCTAVGKAILAFQSDEELYQFLQNNKLARLTPNTIVDPQKLLNHLKKVRTQGYAIDQEELELGLKCIGAPIRNYQENSIAGISISGPASRFTKKRMHNELIPLAVSIALKISKQLGFKGI